MNVVSSKVYEYALSKPLDSGGAPPGYSGHRKANKLLTWKYRHGIVQYPKPLPKESVLDHRLEPLTITDPSFMDTVYRLVYNDIMTQMVDRGHYATSIDGGKNVLLENDFDQPGGRYVLQAYDRIGNKAGRPVYKKTIAQMARVLWKLFSPRRKKTYTDIISKDI